VTHYLCLYVSADGRVIGDDFFAADTKEAALTQAQSLLGAHQPRVAGVELWSRGEHLATIGMPHALRHRTRLLS
jgi:hypothetical protein